ncbi:M1 family metallopeptidase [Fodinicola acaciae]|uniref:M1 family metallopeptidase n=1 Tax=Fodinicola acaciae TaxID=2681555 RepID=UPI0013D3B11E|nr:M1 family metallopeptidase [Fodinicola acaciae]
MRSKASRSTPAPGADRSTDPYLPEHGNGGYRVERYDLDLDYRVGPNRLSGVARLSVVATQALSRLSLDLSGFRVDRVLVDGKAAKFSRSGGKLHVKPAKAVQADASFRVEVRYSGNPRPVPGRWGDIGWDELTNGVLVASQPIGAPSWFPCNDHPSDRASYRVAISVDSPYVVLVTGNLVSRRQRATSTTWTYERPEPTPTYLMSVQIGQYDEVRISDGQRAAMPARLRKVFGKDFGRQRQIMSALEGLFGPYPFGEYVIVVTDDDLDDPIEAQGMSIFGANHLDGRRTHERLAVHELAHQWFGNSLTVADWRQIWLNEGFATYAEWIWSETSGGRPADAHAREWHDFLAAGPNDVVVADPGVDRLFDPQVYKRGGLTLHALRKRLGDERFFSLVKEWSTTRRHSPVTTEEFVAVAEACAGESLHELFEAWLWQTSLPPLP